MLKLQRVVHSSSESEFELQGAHGYACVKRGQQSSTGGLRRHEGSYHTADATEQPCAYLCQLSPANRDVSIWQTFANALSRDEDCGCPDVTLSLSSPVENNNCLTTDPCGILGTCQRRMST
eukprot:364743-Chlamydomonas_euryale.AAC.86